ncbi:MAG: hypothetical protein J6E43_01090 [Prevotella sp.]|nr:hypothetical protein [Prevotella sp.]MBQ3845806.1 hypothetical protein [Bacteroidales bacterium]
MKKNEQKKGVRERKPNYKEYRASVDDIQTFLLGKIMLRHNVITRRVEYCFPSDSIGVSAEWQPISDRVVNSLWKELSLTKEVSASDIYRVLENGKYKVLQNSYV